MILYDDLIEEIEEVKALFDNKNLLRVNSARNLLMLGNFEGAISRLEESLRDYEGRDLFSRVPFIDFLENWIFIIKTFISKGFLINDKIGFVSFDDLVNRKIVLVDKEDNSISNFEYEIQGKLYLPDYIEIIEEECFHKSFLKEVVFGKNVRFIDERAFRSAVGLKKVVIPEKVEDISDDCFWGCGALEEVKIHKNVQSIRDNAFRGCFSLKEINIGEGVTSIGEYSFAACNNLKTLNFMGNKIHFIGEGAFHRCRNLEQIDFDSKAIVVDGDAFKDCGKCVVNIYSRDCKNHPKAFEGCKKVNRYYC